MADTGEQVKEAVGAVKRSSGESLKSRAAKKVLVPLAASAASAAAAYAAKKGPELFQKKVLPRVREAGGVGALAQQVWEKVGSKLPEVPERGEGERAPTEQTANTGVDDSAAAKRETPAKALSTEERERQRQEREARRRQRRKATSTS
jgi:hypothetical protein